MRMDLTIGQLMKRECKLGQLVLLFNNNSESACHVLILNNKTHQF